MASTSVPTPTPTPTAPTSTPSPHPTPAAPRWLAALPASAAAAATATVIPPARPPIATALRELAEFIATEVIPAEAEFETELAAATAVGRRWETTPTVVAKLAASARRRGLWNLFLPPDYAGGPGWTTVEYARAAEMMGWSPLAAVACNCAAPDTGNAEVLIAHGSAEQRSTWLTPLLDGSIRSAFLMTEPDVASSDARNIATSIVRDGDSYVLNGRKWWATGAGSPDCRLLFVMGKTDSGADAMHQHSIVLVPRHTPGVRIVRPLTVFGYDDAPEGHAEVELVDVRVPVANLVGREGDGFVIGQGRLGRGRIHHCMRAVGLGERCLAILLARAIDGSRMPFGRRIAEHATTQATIADCRARLDAARLLVLQAAARLDAVGVRGARKEIAGIKVAVPAAVLAVIDAAIQVHGAAGVSDDTVLARAWAGMRTLRIADGPDVVHQRTAALLELRDFARACAAWDAAHPSASEAPPLRARL